jgi:hypothetical protein
MKKQLKTIRVIFYLFALVILFTNCEKHTTPNKLDKKLTKGTWRVGKAFINNENITSTYSGYLFKFTSNKNIEVSGTVVTSGAWYRGDNKNPVILFISLPASFPELYIFSDDWQVNQLSDSQVVMKRNDNSEDELILRKVG